MKIETKIVPVLILILLTPLSAYGELGMGSLEIDIKSTSGERVDYHGMALRIYQDFKTDPFQIVESISSNPYNISLPLGHKYKVELYASSMYASVGYENLLNNNEKLELIVPNPGSVRFTAVYNDGNTPIDGASVLVKSNDGAYEYWTSSTTDNVGSTIRFWLQPTILNDEYYVVNISIGNDLLYSYYPITITPGMSRDVKIVAPWPAVEPLLVVSVRQSPVQKVSESDGNLMVELYDYKENKIAESKVNGRGEAYFSNLKVGNYIFRAVDLNDGKNEEWGITNMIVDGKQTQVQIFKNRSLIKNEDPLQAPFVTNSRENIIQYSILNTTQTEKINKDDMKPIIPSWIKNMADWWIHGKISDAEFLKLIEYVVQNKIIVIQYSLES